jgi:hypothetical protein
MSTKFSANGYGISKYKWNKQATVPVGKFYRNYRNFNKKNNIRDRRKMYNEELRNLYLP